MIESVFRTIEDHAMFQKGDSVMVCVSGGADSMALLHFLWSARARLGLSSLAACHLNHGLRGAESDAEENLVREFCRLLAVPLSVERAEMLTLPPRQGESVELRARKLRYAFFERCAGTEVQRIAVAHNQNDNAETILFNLARGTGLRGAGGIPPVRGRYVRPFIDLPRTEIETYCAENRIPYAVDSSNLSDVHTRNRIRHSILPGLLDVNAAAVGNLTAFARISSQANLYIEEEAKGLLQRARKGGGYDARLLLDAKEIVLHTALKKLVETACEPSQDRVNLCLEVLRGEKSGFQLSDTAEVVLTGGVLRIEERGRPVPEGAAMPLSEGKTSFCDGVAVVCTTERVDIHNSDKETLKCILNNCIDCDRIIGSLFLRPRQAGDRFASNRRGVTKSLKNIFQERGIKAGERGRFPLVCDDSGIAFIPGEGPSRQHAVTDTTVTVKRIIIKKEEN